MATDLKAGKIDAATIPTVQTTVQQLAETMRLTAICGLGTVPPNSMTTLLTHYGDDVKRKIKAGTKTR